MFCVRVLSAEIKQTWKQRESLLKNIPSAFNFNAVCFTFICLTAVCFTSICFTVVCFTAVCLTAVFFERDQLRRVVVLKTSFLSHSPLYNSVPHSVDPLYNSLDTQWPHHCTTVHTTVERSPMNATNSTQRRDTLKHTSIQIKACDLLLCHTTVAQLSNLVT